MRQLLLLLTLPIVLCPAAAQAHELSSSTARTEARFYAETLVESGVGTRYRIHSCRRHSKRAVSCGLRICDARGYRCGGRVRTAYLAHAGGDTVSRAFHRCG